MEKPLCVCIKIYKPFFPLFDYAFLSTVPLSPPLLHISTGISVTLTTTASNYLTYINRWQLRLTENLP